MNISNRVFSIFALVVAVLATGCAVTPVPYGAGAMVGASAGAPYGYYDNGTAGLRVAPCQPYRADALMGWAKELGNESHSRSAYVSNQNGVINCSTNESASSYTRSK